MPEQILTDVNGNIAAQVKGALSVRADRYHGFPADRRTEEVIAERMLMAALRNYRRAMQSKADFADFKTHDQMSDIECGFYENAVRTAYAAIWGGR